MTAPPREPTPEMIAAGLARHEPQKMSGERLALLWRAMYDAAPAPSAEPIKNRVSDGSRQFPPNRDPGRVSLPMKGNDDDESYGGYAHGVAGEGDGNHLRSGCRDGEAGRDRSGEHDAGLLHPQQHADRCGGNATRLLIDNETLRQQIAADPDDSEPSAGSAGSAEPPATDDLVRNLRASALVVCDAAADAITVLRATIERQAREIAVLQLAVKDDAQWAQENERLTRERDEWKCKYGDANEWGLRNAAAWKDRAERAEAERDVWKDKAETRGREGCEARAERDALRADAERYRKVRDLMTHEHSGPHVGWTLGVLLPGDDPDDAVDVYKGTTMCWSCCSTYPMTQTHCPCGAPNANMNLDAAIDAARAKVKP